VVARRDGRRAAIGNFPAAVLELDFTTCLNASTRPANQIAADADSDVNGVVRWNTALNFGGGDPCAVRVLVQNVVFKTLAADAGLGGHHVARLDTVDGDAHQRVSQAEPAEGLGGGGNERHDSRRRRGQAQRDAGGINPRGGHASRTSGASGPNILSGFESSQSEGRTLLSASGFLPRTDTFNIFTWSSNALAVFSALESNGFAYTVAEPSLTALSGQTATFLAGGELPIPMRTGSGSDSSVTVKFKEFGIRLGLAPTVLDQQRIALKVAPEVSEIDPALAVEIGGFNIPGLRVRRTETTVALGDGETFVISGLVSRESIGSIDKFPFLGDIPVLGAFFKSNRIERNDKELLMIVTPRLVRPFSAKAKLPEMPGEELKRYDPGFLHMLLMERGRFDGSESGFSQ